MSAHHNLIEAARSNAAPLSEWEASFLADMAGRSAASPRQMGALARIVSRRSVAEIAVDLSGRLESLVETLCGDRPMEPKGAHLRVGAKGSLSIEMEGPKAGTFYDHEADVGGGALRLVAHLRRCSTADAIQWAVDWLGGSPTVPHRSVAQPAAAGPEPCRTIDAARRVWREAVPAAGTAAETYLASRGLSLPDAPALRFHPRCQRGHGPDAELLPAMVALMSDPGTAVPCGVHRTFLRADGSGKAAGDAKMMLGNVGVIRLVPDAEVTLGLGLAEGIETALSVMQAFGWAPLWAATSAGAIKRFPVLAGIECLTVFADADRPGQDAARALAERWADAGKEAQILAAPRGDFNDLAREVAA